MALAILGLQDGLVRGVLAGGVTAAAFYAEVLIDFRLGNVVEIEILPIRDIAHGAAAEILDCAVTLLIHPARQAGYHFFDNLEAIGHGGSADLHRAAGQRDEFSGVAPVGNAADA